MKVRHMGIIKGNMAILPNAEAHNIRRIVPQKRFIPAALRLRVIRVSIETIHGCKGSVVEQSIPQKLGESLGRSLLQAYVLIHVEGVNPGKVYPGILPEPDQEIHL